MLRVVAPWFVYLARCSDGTLYAGIARDVRARIARHNAGKGARYTRGRGPLRVLVTGRCASKGDALRLELAIKRLARDQKLAIAASRRKLTTLAKACAVTLRTSRRANTRKITKRLEAAG
jgi:putative endonuclease